MNRGLTASSPPSSVVCPPPLIPSISDQRVRSFSSNLAAPRGSLHHPLCLSELKFTRSGPKKFSRFNLSCKSSTNPGGPPSPGADETKSVLNAFFLGKALAEALNERIESTVGEFLSTVGRLQAEQQKQVQDFQEDVLERAKRAKEKAAREAMEAQGLIPSSATENESMVRSGVASEVTSSVPSSTTPANSSNSSVQPAIANPEPTDTDPLLGVSNED